MKDLTTKRPMLAWLMMSVAAAVISALLLNPSFGLPALLGSAGSLAMALRLVAGLLVVGAGATLTYVAVRLASGPGAFGLVPAVNYTPGRRLATGSAAAATQLRTADQALDELEEMIGLGQVKE